MPLVETAEYFLIPRQHLRRASLGAAVVIAGLVILHRAWLPLVAGALVVNEPLQQADAIIVLGGGSGDREATGARLFADGLAPVMVTTGGKILLPGLAGLTWAELSAEELIRQGVPDSKIIRISNSTSTCEDAQFSIAALPDSARRVIMVTDPFHTRRAQWLFEQSAPGLEVIAVAADPSWFDPAVWWTEERGLIVVFQEYIKFSVSWLKGCD